MSNAAMSGTSAVLFKFVFLGFCLASARVAAAGLRAQRRIHAAPHSMADSGAPRLSLFCFAWTPLNKGDRALLPLAAKEFAACDGHAIFTDKDAPEATQVRSGNESTDRAYEKQAASLVRVAVPTQTENRTSEKWLYHKNMVGLLPAMNVLLKDKSIEKYDWILNSELDHFLRPTKIRAAIAQYMQILRTNGSAAEKQAVDGGPMMFDFGNAFLFNRRMVQELTRQWSTFGKQITQAGSPGVGCPDWMKGRPFWPAACAQDIVFPIMARIMEPPVMQFGASGCGQTRTIANKQELPMACWDLSKAKRTKGAKPEDEQLAAIRSIAGVKDPAVSLVEAEESDMWTTSSNLRSDDIYATRLESTLRAAQMALEDIEAGSGGEARQATPFLAALEAGAETRRTWSMAHRVVHALAEMQREHAQRSSAQFDPYPDTSIPLIHHCQYPSGHALAQKLLPL